MSNKQGTVYLGTNFLLTEDRYFVSMDCSMKSYLNLI